ncbi:MAG: TMEM175 family protein [Candidatus Acidiferrales bacterium]
MKLKHVTSQPAGKEPEFRWRSGEITRIEGFSDAVFAFAIALLVVSLEVPKTYGELWQAMVGFVGFAFCFALLFFVWHNQYTYFRRYGLQDSYSVVLNGALIFVVLFYVYPLKFLARVMFNQMILGTGTAESALNDVQAHHLMSIYGFGFAAVSLIFVLLYSHAYTLRNELQLNALELIDTRESIGGHSIMLGVSLLSAGIAFLPYRAAVTWSGLTYFSIAIFLTLQGTYMGRKRRRLWQQQGRG